jgi:hypothetical protein
VTGIQNTVRQNHIYEHPATVKTKATESDLKYAAHLVKHRILLSLR